MKRILIFIISCTILNLCAGCSSNESPSNIISQDISNNDTASLKSQVNKVDDIVKSETNNVNMQKKQPNESSRDNENKPNKLIIKSFEKVLSNARLLDYNSKTGLILYTLKEKSSQIGGFSSFGKELLMMKLDNRSVKKVTDTNLRNQNNFSMVNAKFSPDGSNISMEATYGYFVEDEECPTDVYLIKNDNAFDKKLIGDKEGYSIEWQGDKNSYVLRCGYLYKIINNDGNVIKEIRNVSLLLAKFFKYWNEKSCFNR